MVSKEGTGTPSGQEMIWLLVQIMLCIMPGTGQLSIPGPGWMWSRGDGMGTGASSSQLLMGCGGKYTELQAHAKQSPVIFIKQKVNMPRGMGGKLLYL